MIYICRLAYHGGVTRAVTAPVSKGFLAGLSTTIDTGASHALEEGAVIQAETALHVAVSLQFTASVSTQIATLRRLLNYSKSDGWTRVRKVTFHSSSLVSDVLMRLLHSKGTLPLVVNVENADIMATLLSLKSEYEASSGSSIHLTFTGASEAHLLAEEIGKADVSVVLTSLRPYPMTWEKRRM